MDLEEAKKLISNCIAEHNEFLLKAIVAEKYYRTKNDILLNKDRDECNNQNPLKQEKNY